MIPLVLIKSYGREPAIDLINGVLTSNREHYDIPTLKFGEHELKVYKTDIVTKYYKTQIALFECADIASVPDEVLANVEGVIIYFDPDDKSFVTELNELHEVITSNNIEAAYLISKNISDCGVVYDEIKQKYPTQFAIIDLKEPAEDDGNDEYAEVVDLLRNNVWSNINVGSSKLSTALDYSDESGEGDLAHLEEEDIEKHLNDFEDLINSIQNFKIMSQNMSREDVLNNAEKLAEHFAKIMKDD